MVRFRAVGAGDKGRLFAEVRVNGEPWTEADLNAALAGTLGVPVGLVAGDDKCCEQAAKRLPGVRTLVLKQALGRHVATSMSPQRAREEIERAALRATAGRGARGTGGRRPLRC